MGVTGSGKISAKVGTLTFSRAGWTRRVGDAAPYQGREVYVATMRTVRSVGTGKAKKTYTDVLTLTLDPGKGWTEDQLAGQVGTFNGNVSVAEAEEGINADTVVSARRNPFGDNVEAKEALAGVRESAPKSLVDDNGTTWKLAVSDKGVATISRTTGSGKNKKTLTATAIVEVARDGEGYSATARFAVSGKVVEATW